MTPRVNVTVTYPIRDTDLESPTLWTDASIDVTVEHPGLTAGQLVNAAAKAADMGCASLNFDALESPGVDF